MHCVVHVVQSELFLNKTQDNKNTFAISSVTGLRPVLYSMGSRNTMQPPHFAPWQTAAAASQLMMHMRNDDGKLSSRFRRTPNDGAPLGRYVLLPRQGILVTEISGPWARVQIINDHDASSGYVVGGWLRGEHVQARPDPAPAEEKTESTRTEWKDHSFRIGERPPGYRPLTDVDEDLPQCHPRSLSYDSRRCWPYMERTRVYHDDISRIVGKNTTYSMNCIVLYCMF